MSKNSKPETQNLKPSNRVNEIDRLFSPVAPLA